MIITIDGPSASGKSTVARMLAKKLGYFYLYSGLLYRALAYLLINEKVYLNEKEYGADKLENPDIADIYELLQEPRFLYTYNDGIERIFFDGQDITPHLKDNFIAQSASRLSTNEQVRKYLDNVQQKIAQFHNTIVDGRDGGSVTFAYADIKFYLTANQKVRAQRWLHDRSRTGNHMSLEQAIEELKERDDRDCKRVASPLCIPDDAIIIDSTNMTPEQVVERMMQQVESV